MDIQDLIFDSNVSYDLKLALLELMRDHSVIYPYTKVVTPTDTNDDVNGSQHAHNGGTDFTYRDATDDDVLRARSVGFYEYFSNYGGVYTGHYYNDDMSHFEAVVLDPPTYAISSYV